MLNLEVVEGSLHMPPFGALTVQDTQKGLPIVSCGGLHWRQNRRKVGLAP
jgi:hypothetical protein